MNCIKQYHFAMMQGWAVRGEGASLGNFLKYGPDTWIYLIGNPDET